MKGKVDVVINYNSVWDNQKWDGLKGYITDSDKTAEEIYAAYEQLWRIERAFRVAESKLDIRPIFHFTRKKPSTYLCLLHRTQGVQGVGTPTCDGQHPDERRQSPLLCEDDYFYQSQEKTGKVITRVMLLKPRQKALAPLFNDPF